MCCQFYRSSSLDENLLAKPPSCLPWCRHWAWQVTVTVLDSHPRIQPFTGNLKYLILAFKIPNTILTFEYVEIGLTVYKFLKLIYSAAFQYFAKLTYIFFLLCLFPGSKIQFRFEKKFTSMENLNHSSTTYTPSRFEIFLN